MIWTAVVPLKSPGHRKTRLAPFLDAADRDRLALEMFWHVARTLTENGGDVVVLSPSPPTGWHGRWAFDSGTGLNRELDLLQSAIAAPWAVVHGDLPLLCGDDVAALFSAAHRSGAAFAPDRHGPGTNAVALADGHPLAFCFGGGSMGKFVEQRTEPCAIVCRRGLEHDVDTPADLLALRAEVPAETTRRAVSALAPAPVLAVPDQRRSLDMAHDQLAAPCGFRIWNVHGTSRADASLDRDGSGSMKSLSKRE